MKKTLILLLTFALLLALAFVPAASAKTLETPSGYTAYNIESGSVSVGSGKYHIYGSRNQTANSITVNAGATAEIILDDVKIDTDATSYIPAIKLDKNAVLTLKLAGDNELTGGRYRAGIHVPGGTKLTITSQSGDGSREGMLKAWACPNYIVNGHGDFGNGAAAIGANGIMNQNNPIETLGDIIINGGSVYATGATGGAGIGGAGYSETGSVTINGGYVSASVDDTSRYSSGAGIGGGALGYVPQIAIHGGYVTAWGSSVGGAADIGGGYAGGSYGNIVITGGTVYAWQIGNEKDSSPNQTGSVVITGGSVRSNRIDNPRNSQGQPLVAKEYPQDCENGTPIQSATFTNGYAYGLEDVVVQDGKFTFWLPEGIEATPQTLSYTVTFHANGASGSMESVKAYGKYTLPYTHGFTPNNPAQLFVGWAYSAGGAIIKDRTIQVTKNTDLYAIWKEAEAAYSVNGGPTQYDTFEYAMAAAMNADSIYIRLLKDVENSTQRYYQNRFLNGKDVTLDLNGKTLKGSDCAPIGLNNTKMTIVDTSGTQGKVDGGESLPAVYVDEGCELIIHAGVYSGSRAVVCDYNTTLTIHAGTFASKVSFNEGSLTVHSGTFKGDTALSIGSEVQAEIFSGTFEGESFSLSSAGTVTIHDGMFSVENTIPTYGTVQNSGTMTIHGGIFGSKGGFAVDNSGILTVTGGDFESGTFGAEVGITQNSTLDFSDYAQAEGVSLFARGNAIDNVEECITLAPGYAVLMEGTDEAGNPTMTPVTSIEGWTSGYTIGLLPLHKIAVTETEGGTVGVSQTVAAQDMEIVIYAEPYDDYMLTGIAINGNELVVSGAGGQYMFYMLDEDVTITAEFALKHEHDWVYEVNGATINCVCWNNDSKCPNGNDGGSVTLTTAGLKKVYDGEPLAVTVDNTLVTNEAAATAYTNRTTGQALSAAPTDAGSYTVSVTAGGKTVSADFDIMAHSLEGASISVTGTHEYDGNVQTPEVTVVVDEKTLGEGDYSLTCQNNIDAGLATVIVTGKGNYTGSQSTTFAIAQADGEASVSLAGWMYGETPNAPVPVSQTNGTDGVSYTYAGTENSGAAYGPSAEVPVNAGSYSVTAVFPAVKNYKAVTAAADFTVDKAQAAAPSGLNAVYGQKLSDVLLPENWEWVNGDAVVGGDGANTYRANYAGSDNYLPAGDVALTVAVRQSQTEMTAELMDNKSEYTYGETIRISVVPKATGSSAKKLMARFAAPKPGEVSLWNGENQIAPAQPAANGQEVTFDLPTVENGLTPGSYTLMAKYTESDNMAAQTAEVSFTVAYAETEKQATESGKQLENGIYVEQPTLTAPEGTQISLDPAVWPEDNKTGNSLTLPTQEGTHTYTYYVKLEDGTIAEKTVTVTVDTTAPEVEEPTVLADPTSVVITVTATDAGSGVMDIGLKMNSGEGDLVIEGNGDGSYTITGLIPGETYDFTLTVTDRAGHTTAVSFSVTAPRLPALPQTGDHSALSLWLVLMTLAGVGIMMLRRREQN